MLKALNDIEAKMYLGMLIIGYVLNGTTSKFYADQNLTVVMDETNSFYGFMFC